MLKLAIVFFALIPLGEAHSDPKDITKVFQYSCEANFLAGSGVSLLGLNCSKPNFYLEFLRASYQFYTQQKGVHATQSAYGNSGEDGDMSGLVCGLTLPRYTCAFDDHLVFGLSNQVTAKFNLRVELTGDPLGRFAVSGYAAAPKKDGTCPNGLVKANVYTASPKTEPNSTLVTENGANSAFLVATTQPSNFQVFRETNHSQPCSINGNCHLPTDGAILAQTVAYQKHTESAACVIPPEALH